MKVPAKTESTEYLAFTSALKKVLAVSRSEMKAKLDDEKRVRKQRRGRASGHVSRAKN